MKREGVLLAFVATATCLFTFNSVQQLSSEIAVAERHQLWLGQTEEAADTRPVPGKASLQPLMATLDVQASLNTSRPLRGSVRVLSASSPSYVCKMFYFSPLGRKPAPTVSCLLALLATASPFVPLDVVQSKSGRVNDWDRADLALLPFCSTPSPATSDLISA